MARNLLTPYTCSIIDSNISEIEGAFRDILSDLIDDIAPRTDDEFKAVYIKSSWDDFKDTVTSSFEEVRKTNERLREEAEETIDDLKDQIQDLKKEIERLETELSEQE